MILTLIENLNDHIEDRGKSSISSGFSKWMARMLCSDITIKNIENNFKRQGILVLYLKYKISNFRMQAVNKKILNCPWKVF